jgi:hypothetical protein
MYENWSYRVFMNFIRVFKITYIRKKLYSKFLYVESKTPITEEKHPPFPIHSFYNHLIFQYTIRFFEVVHLHPKKKFLPFSLGHIQKWLRVSVFSGMIGEQNKNTLFLRKNIVTILIVRSFSCDPIYGLKWIPIWNH